MTPYVKRLFLRKLPILLACALALAARVLASGLLY
jgi:hypothetical protein